MKPRTKTSHTNVGFTIPAFAREFGLSEGTIRRAVKAGEIATVKFGGLLRITPLEVERFREMFYPIKRDWLHLASKELPK